MEIITSGNNAQVKNIIQLNQKAKVRKEQKLFVVEGKKMFLEAPKTWIEKVFISETLLADSAFMKHTEGIKYEVVADKIFTKMSDTQTPQGVLTVMRQPEYKKEDLLKKENPLLLVLEDLQDPGNIGTILRTGEGAGVSGVFLTKKAVDIFNPKVIRSTMGSIYRIPFFYIEDVVSLEHEFRKYNIHSYAAHLNGKNAYDQENYVGGTVFFIGNEGNGLTDGAAAAADTLIRIPMEGKVESLNAAMASGILMYEAYRQRRNR